MPIKKKNLFLSRKSLNSRAPLKCRRVQESGGCGVREKPPPMTSCLSPLGQKRSRNRDYLPLGPPRMFIIVPIASFRLRCRLSSSSSMTLTGDNVLAFGLSGSTVRLRREPVISRVSVSTSVCAATSGFTVGSNGTVLVAQPVTSTATAQMVNVDTNFNILSTTLTSLSTFPVDRWRVYFTR